MNREAIQYLIDVGISPEHTMEIVESLNQEPCDAVSRKAAIDACLKGLNRKEMVSNIKALPPVTPAEKAAHWIVHPKGIYAHLVCSNCLSSAPYDCKTNYCPNCGRKMEEVEE